jgi:hypothetical protein
MPQRSQEMDSAMLHTPPDRFCPKIGAYAQKSLPPTRKFPVNYSDASDFERALLLGALQNLG